jgi:phosphoglycolate phosphatase
VSADGSARPEFGDVLFDLDGTLTDSKPGIVNSTRYALRRYNETVDTAPIVEPTSLDFMLGPPLRESFAKFVEPSQVETLVRFYLERYRPIGVFENSVYDGIRQALEDLRALGFRLFVATSKNETDARRIVDHYDLARFFDGVYGAELHGTRANKKELIAHVVKRHDIDPRLAAMIGDREHDAIGARAGGVWAIGALWGYGSREELSKAGANPLLESPSEIAPALKEGFASRLARRR